MSQHVPPCDAVNYLIRRDIADFEFAVTQVDDGFSITIGIFGQPETLELLSRDFADGQVRVFERIRTMLEADPANALVLRMAKAITVGAAFSVKIFGKQLHGGATHLSSQLRITGSSSPTVFPPRYVRGSDNDTTWLASTYLIATGQGCEQLLAFALLNDPLVIGQL